MVALPATGYDFLGKIFTDQDVELAKGEIRRFLLEGGCRTVCEPNSLMTIRKIMNFCDQSEHLAGMRDALTDIAASLLGAPAELMVDNALLKPPRVGGASRWHQDQAILEVPPNVKIYGFWVCLEKTDRENGCMQIYPGIDVKYQHMTDDGWYIPVEKLPEGEPAALEMMPGEVAVWNGMAIHGSGPNTSERSRWSLQYHFKPRAAVFNPN
jgi:phytanoyl-CoA hydroxylase